MSALLAKVALGIIVLAVIAAILFLIVPKKKRKTHFQSKIKNTTSYNIGSIESEPQRDKEMVDDYLKEKDKQGAQPFNRGDYEMYND